MQVFLGGLNTYPYPSLAVIWLRWELTDINKCQRTIIDFIESLYSESQVIWIQGILSLQGTHGELGEHIGNRLEINGNKGEWIGNCNVSHFRTPENWSIFKGTNGIQFGVLFFHEELTWNWNLNWRFCLKNKEAPNIISLFKTSIQIEVIPIWVHKLHYILIINILMLGKHSRDFVGLAY